MPIIRPAWGGVNLNSLVKYSIRKGSTIVPARLISEAAAKIQDSLGRPPRSRQGFQEDPRMRFQVFISKSPRSNRAADYAPVADLDHVGEREDANPGHSGSSVRGGSPLMRAGRLFLHRSRQ